MMSGQLPGSSSGAVPSSLHSALQMNPQPPPHMNVKQPSPNQEIPSPSSVTAGTKRRRKNDIGDGEGQSGPSEPRRLRRSHEACARCRGKKIKCDSKHPRCTACQTAGVECNQEDRHRQTLTPRGYTERVELQLAQCEALLKRHLPGFEMANIEDFLARDGIEISDNHPSASFGFASSPLRSSFRPDGGPPPKGGQGQNPYMYPRHQ
ncbi:hypothetical protein CPB85DRAFT_227442 [Mucidula mucida]|nr:hypothetical protein CPB85DRAFT_227442 [Mucidula mucida]